MQHPASLACMVNLRQVAKFASWFPTLVIWATATVATQGPWSPEGAMAAEIMLLNCLNGPTTFQDRKKVPPSTFVLKRAALSFKLCGHLRHERVFDFRLVALIIECTSLNARQTDMGSDHCGMAMSSRSE